MATKKQNNLSDKVLRKARQKVMPVANGKIPRLPMRQMQQPAKGRKS